jgi:GH43 family beta-xylosidase
VTFDGEQCIYQGPSVLLDGTVLRVEYAPTIANPQDTMLLVAGVLPGTTLADVLSEDNKNYTMPPWLVVGYMTQQYGPGTTSYTITSFHREPLGGHFLGCSMKDSTDFWPATLLLVAGG